MVPFFIDIDECVTESANECDLNALCTNIEGSYVCRCIRGYEGDGRQCSGNGISLLLIHLLKLKFMLLFPFSSCISGLHSTLRCERFMSTRHVRL